MYKLSGSEFAARPARIGRRLAIAAGQQMAIAGHRRMVGNEPFQEIDGLLPVVFALFGVAARRRRRGTGLRGRGDLRPVLVRDAGPSRGPGGIVVHELPPEGQCLVQSLLALLRRRKGKRCMRPVTRTAGIEDKTRRAASRLARTVRPRGRRCRRSAGPLAEKVVRARQLVLAAGRGRGFRRGRSERRQGVQVRLVPCFRFVHRIVHVAKLIVNPGDFGAKVRLFRGRFREPRVQFDRPQIGGFRLLVVAQSLTDVANAAIGLGNFAAQAGIVAPLIGQTIIELEHVLQQRGRLFRQHRLDRHRNRIFRVAHAQRCRSRGGAVRCELPEDAVQRFHGQGRGLFGLLPLHFLLGVGSAPCAR